MGKGHHLAFYSFFSAGAVLLQGCAAGGGGADAQEPAGTVGNINCKKARLLSRSFRTKIYNLKLFIFFQVFIIMNPIDLNLEPPILAVRTIRINQRFFSNFESRKIFGKRISNTARVTLGRSRA